VTELLGLVTFSFVSTVTPGPNNVVLWASGAKFGLRATARHIAGTALGIGSMAIAVAAGVGVIATVPAVALGLKIAGSVYLVYLAYRIAASHALDKADVARPLGVGQAALFQCVNPKAWIFVLAAMSAFRPDDLGVVVGSAVTAAVMAIVSLPSMTIWALGGTVVSRLLAGRTLSILLAVLLVASVGQLWI
jgi:threonine/homoserine/homoserine lactone efflux protein